MHTFATAAPVSAFLDLPAGHIQLIAGDRADTTVSVLPTDPAKSSDVQAAERTTVDYADGVLRVHTPENGSRLFGPSGSVEVTVQLPAGSPVEAKAASARFRGVGRLGDVAFECAQGTVKLDETADARLDLQDGDVSVGRLGGSAEISTRKGGIDITEAVRGTVALRTESGGISVGTAPGVSASLDAGTAHGRIHNALTNTGGADTGLRITATTSHGDITARSL